MVGFTHPGSNRLLGTALCYAIFRLRRLVNIARELVAIFFRSGLTKCLVSMSYRQPRRFWSRETLKADSFLHEVKNGSPCGSKPHLDMSGGYLPIALPRLYTEILPSLCRCSYKE